MQLTEVDHAAVAFELAFRLVGIFVKLVGLAVDPVCGLAELLVGDYGYVQGPSDQRRQFVLGTQIGRIGQPDEVGIVPVFQNQRLEPACLNLGKNMDHFRHNIEAAQIDKGKALLLGNHPRHLLFGDEIVFDQHTTEHASGALLLRQRLGKPDLGQVAMLDQRGTQLFCFYDCHWELPKLDMVASVATYGRQDKTRHDALKTPPHNPSLFFRLCANTGIYFGCVGPTTKYMSTGPLPLASTLPRYSQLKSDRIRS